VAAGDTTRLGHLYSGQPFLSEEAGGAKLPNAALGDRVPER